jgi:hypothetical protein
VASCRVELSRSSSAELEGPSCCDSAPAGVKGRELALPVPRAGSQFLGALMTVARTRLGPYAVTWDVGHLVQSGRLFRGGTPACGNGRSFPGLASSHDQLCEIYPFINNAGSTDLITVTQTGVTDVNAFFSAWLLFSPDDLLAHGDGYLGDAGFSYWPDGEFPRTFSFLVPAARRSSSSPTRSTA